MQMYSVIEITNLEPLKIGAGGNKASQTEPSKDYIPGSTIRGTIIGQLIRRDKKSFDNNLTAILTQMECYNAYPFCGEDLYVPTPHHLRMNKHEWRKAKVLSAYDSEGKIRSIALTDLQENNKSPEQNVQEKSSDQNELENKKIQHQNALAYRFISVQENKVSGLNTMKEYRLHHNTSRNMGKEERNNLFRYQALAPGHTFRSIIRYDASLEKILQPVLEHTTHLYIGGAKGSGYGLCRMRLVSGTATEYEEAKKSLGLHINSNLESAELTITCLSDCLCRNKYGQPINYIPESEIESLCGVSVKLEKESQYVQTGMTEGYNTTWGARYPKETTLKAGSVLVYSMDRTLNQYEKQQVIHALESSLVGYRTQDGYGWIGVNMDYPEQLLVQAVRPLSVKKERLAESSTPLNAKQEQVMSIILSGLEETKQRWLDMLCIKLWTGREQKNEFIISDQLNRSQLQHMKDLLEPLIKQLKAGQLPLIPDSIDRSYKKDNQLCSIAGFHFMNILKFICSTNPSLNTLRNFAENKLNSKKGKLFYSSAGFPEQQFIAELLYSGLHIQHRRNDK